MKKGMRPRLALSASRGDFPALDIGEETPRQSAALYEFDVTPLRSHMRERQCTFPGTQWRIGIGPQWQALLRSF
jgi:hypothetical protein